VTSTIRKYTIRINHANKILFNYIIQYFIIIYL